MHWDAIWVNGSIVTCTSGYGLLEQSAIASKDGKIAWVGKVDELPARPEQVAHEVFDLAGACLTPGFIDCHTHLVYAGNRAQEFEKRLQGVSYEEIAREGGGIQSTVAATRAAFEGELLHQSLIRAYQLMQSGVTTLEIKSGYGLDWPAEEKILRVAALIEKKLPLTVIKTFLGAHTVPKEFKNSADAYVEQVCTQMIPVVAEHRLADAVDVFCEKIAFNLQQTERVFQAAAKHKLGIKCHADQLSNLGATSVAVKYGALSVDHLEYASQDDIKVLGAAGTTAVLLPGAFYFLREKKLPPIDALRSYQVPIALASDCNPGTSPITSILLILNMACTLFRLTPEEALLGVTKNAAKALGLEATHGTLAVGKVADFAVWDVAHPAELTYWIGSNRLQQLVKGGTVTIQSPRLFQ